MNPNAWIALVGLGVAVVGQAIGFVWWAATVNSKVSQLETEAKSHGDIRDLVIEMRTEMRGFRDSIKDLAEDLRQVSRPRAQRVSDQ